MTFVCSCPYCNADFSATDELVGSSVTCVSCGRVFFAYNPATLPPEPPPPPAKPKPNVALGCLFAILLFLTLGIVIALTSGPASTPAQRREQHRLDQLERARAKNYIDNIKPHVPHAP